MMFSLCSLYLSFGIKDTSRMTRHLKFIFAWILLLLQLTGGSVTWYEPTPSVIATDASEVIPPVVMPIHNGTPATLKWNYNLTGAFVILKFNGVNVGSVSTDGKGGVNDKFKDRMTLESTTQSASLVISSVTVADDKANGEFSCELTVVGGDTWKRAIQVLVVVTTKLDEIEGADTVHEGSNLRLICKASGRPEPNITWTKEGSTGVVQNGKLLNIKNINKTDSGTYTCKGFNGFGKEERKEVYVNVTYPAEIVRFQNEYLVGVQGRVTLNCKAEGNPLPNYSWTPCGPKQDCYKNTLDISNVYVDEKYTCRVNNTFGIDTKEANVFIAGEWINITIVLNKTSAVGNYSETISKGLNNVFETVFNGKLDYQGIQLISSSARNPTDSCGNINVKLTLKFDSITKENDVLTLLKNATLDGKLGDYAVNRNCINGTRPDKNEATTEVPASETPHGIAGWVIPVVAVVCAFILIFLVVLAILLKKKGVCSHPVNNGKHPRVQSNEGGDAEMEPPYSSGDNQYAAAGPNANYHASNQSSAPSPTYEVANRRSEEKRGRAASPPIEPLPEYAVVDKTKKKKRPPKPGAIQYAELGELTGPGKKTALPRVSGTDTVYSDIRS